MPKLLIPEDLRNPARKSGFEYVSIGGNGRGFQGSRNGGGRPDGWRGPLRRSAEQAAQDYCNYVNGLAPVLRPPRRRTPVLKRHLQRAKHPVRRIATIKPRTPKQPSALVRARAGFVYLVGIALDETFVKIGWSAVNGFPRLNELQTGNPHLLVGIAEVPGTLADEYALHCRYEPDNVLNEWFRVSDELLSEFELTDEEFRLIVHTADVRAAV